MRSRVLALTLILGLAACQSDDPLGNDAKTAGNALTDIYVHDGDAAAPADLGTDNGAAMTENIFVDNQSLDSWVGRWSGVEGTYLGVSKASAAGHYRLDMQYTLDAKGSFEGIIAGDGISFTRPDGAFVLRASDGDSTGLKYLAGKKDCLKVKPGEAYCRD